MTFGSRAWHRQPLAFQFRSSPQSDRPMIACRSHSLRGFQDTRSAVSVGRRASGISFGVFLSHSVPLRYNTYTVTSLYFSLTVLFAVWYISLFYNRSLHNYRNALLDRRCVAREPSIPGGYELIGPFLLEGSAGRLVSVYSNSRK